jgi:hypothetical protein
VIIVMWCMPSSFMVLLVNGLKSHTRDDHLAPPKGRMPVVETSHARQIGCKCNYTPI